MTFAIALDAQTNDLVFDTNGVLQLTSGPDLVAQRLRVRLNRLLGEWPLNITLGVDYLGTVLVKGPNIEAIRALFTEEISETPGVLSLTSLELVLAQRTLNVTFRVLTDEVILEATGSIENDIASALLTLVFKALPILGATGVM